MLVLPPERPADREDHREAAAELEYAEVLEIRALPETRAAQEIRERLEPPGTPLQDLAGLSREVTGVMEAQPELPMLGAAAASAATVLLQTVSAVVAPQLFPETRGLGVR